MLNKFAFVLGIALAGNAVAETASTSPDRVPTVAASASLNPATPDWQLVLEQRYTLPYGYSFSPIFDFGARPLLVDAIQARIYQELGQVCNAGLYSVDFTESPTQQVMTRVFPDLNGEVRMPETAIYKIGFVFQQSALRASNCLLRLSAITGDDTNNPDQPSGEFELAGVVRYNGGFQDQLALATDGTDKVKQFWVRVPEFCGQVEVLEAGTVTEGHYEAARLVDRAKMIYEVNGGAGSRLSEVRLSINGPRNASCDIPVYFKSVAQ